MRDLLIIGITGLLLFVVFLVALKIYFSGKSDKEKQEAFNKAQERIDKAMKGTDDLSEPARWVR